MKGRPSAKKEQLYLTYKILRCALTGEDVLQLMKMYPGFRDMAPDNTDVEIQHSIYCMSMAMSEVQTPDLGMATPLRAR